MKHALAKMTSVVFLALVLAPIARADISGTSESTSNRMNDRLGGYVSLWGDPFPALLGANLAYNVYDFLRLNAGVGTDSADRVRATTFGVGVKAMIPAMPLTPVVGINWSADSVSGGTATSVIRGIPRGGNRIYANAGIDWQTTLGLNVGAGYNQSLASGGGGSFYLNAGFFL